MIDSAIAFAALAHAGQKRKYTFEPYIVHPIEVMRLVMTVDHCEEMLVAAILHDVIEDTPVGQREIERRFGPAVLELVLDLTKVPVEGNRATRMAAERDRLALASWAAQTIKVADLISNTSTITKYDPGFARVYLPEKAALLEVLTKADPSLLERAHLTLNDGLQQCQLTTGPR